MPVSSGCPPSMPCPRGAISAGCSNAPLGWRPPSASAASHIPLRSRRGAGADFLPAYAGLIGGMLFHLSGFASSPAALGGADCAPRTGESVNPASRAIAETTKHLDISEMPPAVRIQTLRISPRLRQSKSQTRLRLARAAHRCGKGARPSDSYGWNCLPLITIRFLGAVGLALPRKPTGLPFLASMASISTSSPGLNVFLVQPIWLMDTGF